MDLEYKMLMDSLVEFDSCDWTLYQTKKNIKLFYKNDKKSKSLTIKTETVINANFLNMVSMVY